MIRNFFVKIMLNFAGTNYLFQKTFESSLSDLYFIIVLNNDDLILILENQKIV